MLNPKRFMNVNFFENHKDKGLSDLCSVPNLTLHGSVPGIARGCNVPWGHLEESLVSTPLVKPCCSTAHWDPIEVLEGGYGHSIGPGCVPGVPPGPSHHGPHGLRDAHEGQKSKVGQCLQN